MVSTISKVYYLFDRGWAHSLRDGADCSQSKVANFNVVLRVEKNVHWLQVAVDHALLVNVHEPFNDLAEKTPDAWHVVPEALVDGVPE